MRPCHSNPFESPAQPALKADLKDFAAFDFLAYLTYSPPLVFTTDFAPFVKSANQAPDIDDLNIFKPTGTYTYSVRYTELIGILIQGIKDLSTEVNSLKARVTTLEG